MAGKTGGLREMALTLDFNSGSETKIQLPISLKIRTLDLPTGSKRHPNF